jgi:hypothetical protein
LNRFLPILAAICVLVIQTPGIASQASIGPAKTAEHFYAGYLVLMNAQEDPQPWVAKSSMVTIHFKGWYAKQISNQSVEADPVIEAQDTPTTPFKAIKTTIAPW